MTRRIGGVARNALAALLALCITSVAIACDSFGDEEPEAGISDPVLRLVLQNEEGEIESREGELPRGFEEALNAGRADADDPVTLPPPPEATLRGSIRLVLPDGRQTFFVLYEVDGAVRAAADAVEVLVDETPWQVTGGRAVDGITNFEFQNTRADNVSGQVFIQPLPTTNSFDLTISRDGDEQEVTVQRRSFLPVLGVEIEDRDGGAVVSRLVPGVASADLREGDRILRVNDREIDSAAAASEALRGLGGDQPARTSVMYIVQVVPEAPVNTAFVLPTGIALPADFPVPSLVLDGMTPAAVQWSAGSAGTTHTAALLTRQSPPDTVNAYRQALQRENFRITDDTAEGFATTLEFEGSGGSVAGSINVDLFEEDDSFTVVSMQVRTMRGGTGSPLVPTPGGTGTPGPTPSATATGTATAAPTP
jgi:hypothetical protein